MTPAKQENYPSSHTSISCACRKGSMVCSTPGCCVQGGSSSKGSWRLSCEEWQGKCLTHQTISNMIENKKLNKVAPQGREVPGSISKTWFVANMTVPSDLINIMQGNQWSYVFCETSAQGLVGKCHECGKSSIWALISLDGTCVCGSLALASGEKHKQRSLSSYVPLEFF